MGTALSSQFALILLELPFPLLVVSIAFEAVTTGEPVVPVGP